MTVAYYRLDLDKTYLATPLEHKLQLLRMPFEDPSAKRTLPGMAALVQAMRERPGGRVGQADVSIFSASPTFMAKQLRAKLELDGVAVDRFVFRDQWSLVKKGRFKEINDPLAYKLHALCKLAADTSIGDVEILVGDDYDLDPIVYTLYADLRAGLVPTDILAGFFARHDVRPELQQEIRLALDKLPQHDAVANIFIRRERRRGAAYYTALGSRLKTYDDAFQLALLLFDGRYIDEGAIALVAEHLRQRRWRPTAFAFSWRGLIDMHHLERYGEALRTIEDLDLVPKRGLFERLAPFRRPPKPELGQADWGKIVELTSSNE